MIYCNIYIKPKLSEDCIIVNGKKKYKTICPKCLKERFVRKDIYNKNRFGSCRDCQNEDKQTYSVYNTRIYNIWDGMRERCRNKKNKYFKNYGGRGVTVCKEWDEDFYNFFSWSLLNNYKDNLTIDRINNDGNYEPSNCKWSTRVEQMQNTREINSKNKSGYKNICKSGSKYRVFKTINKKRIFDVKFKTLDEAIRFKEKMLSTVEAL